MRALIFLFAKILLGFALTCRADSISSLVQQGETAMDAGRIHQAISILQQTEGQSGTFEENWLAKTALAEALIRSGQLESAEKVLNQNLQAANVNMSKALLGEVALRFGHLYRAKNNESKSQIWYQQALNNAEVAQDHALAATALINIAKQNGKYDPLIKAQTHLTHLTQSDDKNAITLVLGYQANQQNQFQLAYQSFQEVLTQTQNAYYKAQALGFLGDVYEKQQRYQEALQLTELALLQDNSPILKMEWTWQRARLLELSGHHSLALNSYRSAVEQLQNLRVDIPIVYQNGESSFQKTFAPLYLSYINLLLQDAEHEQHDVAQHLLTDVLQIWEQLKSMELQDYFKDSCAIKQKSNTQLLEPNTAALYPILFKDHIALLLQTSHNIYAYRVNHSSVEIVRHINRLRHQIANRLNLTAHKTLYQWLITPLKAELEQQHIDTLVYLPDGVLRKLPLSLLNDGNQFLIEQYALVTVPGLSMLASPSNNIDRKDILLAGLSEPGPVIDELINSGIKFILPNETESRGLTFKRRALPLQDTATKNFFNLERTLRAYKLKESLLLPGVNEELNILSGLTPYPLIKNSEFSLNSFTLSVNRGHSNMHIASHGFFSGNPKQSFIMAYDHLITMEKLTDMFQTEVFHDRPIELVTLSACQTADGDDRSPLGFSGLIVQTGVKSAIGTLWPVEDNAATQFFTHFYRFYQQSTLTKAKAMQIAQLQLIHNKDFVHPSQWGPFVLVGEWH